jgi:hypothetical protein
MYRQSKSAIILTNYEFRELFIKDTFRPKN